MSAPDRVSTSYPEPSHRSPTDDSLFGAAIHSHGEPFGEALPASGPAPVDGGPIDYAAIVGSAEFRELRGRTLRFTLPATALFMGNYLLFVLLSAYAPGLMGTPAIGLINIGILVGVFQFVTTVLIVTAYNRFARLRTDPLAEHIRDEAEGPR